MILDWLKQLLFARDILDYERRISLLTEKNTMLLQELNRVKADRDTLFAARMKDSERHQDWVANLGGFPSIYSSERIADPLEDDTPDQPIATPHLRRKVEEGKISFEKMLKGKTLSPLQVFRRSVGVGSDPERSGAKSGSGDVA